MSCFEGSDEIVVDAMAVIDIDVYVDDAQVIFPSCSNMYSSTESRCIYSRSTLVMTAEKSACISVRTALKR